MTADRRHQAEWFFARRRLGRKHGSGCQRRTSASSPGTASFDTFMKVHRGVSPKDEAVDYEAYSSCPASTLAMRASKRAISSAFSFAV
jgi:hypothetical protein